MFKKDSKALVLLTALILLVMVAEPAKAGKFIYLKVADFYFTTAVSGILLENGSLGTRYILKPGQGRFMVVDCEAEIKQGDVVFSNDFVISYEGEEGKTQEKILGLAVSRTALSEDKAPFVLTGIFILQQGGSIIRITPKTRKIFFSLFFYIDNETREVEIKTFDLEPIKILIGRKRRHSVLVSTNNESLSFVLIKKIISDIQRANCKVIFSRGLKSKPRGVVVFYSVNMQSLAYDISQRISKRIDTSPEVKSIRESLILTSYDILIWIGKGVALKEISL